MQEWKHGEEKGKGRCQEQRHRWSKGWDKLISLITKSLYKIISRYFGTLFTTFVRI